MRIWIARPGVHQRRSVSRFVARLPQQIAYLEVVYWRPSLHAGKTKRIGLLADVDPPRRSGSSSHEPCHPSTGHHLDRSRRRRVGDRSRRRRKGRSQGQGTEALRRMRPREGSRPLPLHRQQQERAMTRPRIRSLGSLLGTSLRTFAFVSLARKLGPRRIARVAALATEGYFARATRSRR